MKHIDNLFKDELGSYAETPPPAVWEALEKRLDGEEKRRVFPYRWLWYFTVLSFIGLIAASLAWKISDKPYSVSANMIHGVPSVPNTHDVTAINATTGLPAQQDVNVKTIAAKLITEETKNTNGTTKNNPNKHINTSAARAITNSDVAPTQTESNTNINTNKQPSGNNTKTIANTDKQTTVNAIADDSNTAQETTANKPVAVQPIAYTETRRKQHNIVVTDVAPVVPGTPKSSTNSLPEMQEMHTETTGTKAVSANVDNSSSKIITRIQEVAHTETEEETTNVPVKNTPVVSTHNTAIASNNITGRSKVHQPVTTVTVASTHSKHTSKKLVRHNAINIAATNHASSNKQKRVAIAQTGQQSATDNNTIAAIQPKQRSKTSLRHKANAINAQDAPVIASSTNRQNPTAKPSKEIAVVKSEHTASSAVASNNPAAMKANNSKSIDGTSVSINRKKIIKDNSKTTATSNKKNNVIAAPPTTNNKRLDRKQIVQDNKLIATNNDQQVTPTTATKHKKNKPVATLSQKAKVTVNTLAAKVATDQQPAKKEVKQPISKLATSPSNRTAIASKKTKFAADTVIAKNNKNTTAIVRRQKKDKSVSSSKKETLIATTLKQPAKKSTGISAKKTAIKQDLIAANNNNKKPVTVPQKNKKPIATSSKIIPAATTAKQPSPKSTIVPTKVLAAQQPAKETKAHQAKSKHATANKTVAAITKPTKPAGKKVASKNTTKHVTKPQLEINNYSSNLPDPAIKDPVSITSQQVAAGDKDQPQLPGTFKTNPSDIKTSLPDSAANNATTDSAAKHLTFAQRFSYGIKGGFESGINKNSGQKGVFSPYVEYRLSSKFSLMAQPSIKVANLTVRNLETKQYYNNLDSSQKLINSAYFLSIGQGGTYDTGWIRQYRYTQTHDSTAKTYSIGGHYYEVELPILLKYALTKKLSVYAGGNIVYSKFVAIKEHSYSSGPITRIDSGVFVPTGPGASTAPTPPYSSYFTNNGNPISSYTGSPYPAQQKGLLQLGYMFGFSYEYRRRWMLDALIQQTFAPQNTVGSYNTNTALSMPYIRLTLGYRLSK